ncbi:methionine adenosyltransferase [Rhizobium bangladeshense]|uniref:methionine adenosyltransferase n=1 Tax=Rhizobium bangladeshense TaxID=1138189 RepID=UPI001C82E3A2|nr:methionine adenosyltransferase [Rhizobium bangladeshense]MBX4893239.1 methionine adenosyltransferase [Rhizobium bangladeshense]MBX4898826.1 methionine adenosyltransferase [Rhizobium bangladeshense]MBY3616876.1 methionine adenosyltransferase [Rhizobium bangladeshense]
MLALTIADLTTAEDAIEVVERKGLGHPDTICDALAETLSRNLCGFYLQRFGRILHHNVDKALLCGGCSTPSFGGGTVDAPIAIYLAGRVTLQIDKNVVPINEIAIEGSRSWLRSNLHALDVERHVQIRTLLRPGSPDLKALFSRDDRTPRANDTSIGVGYAPLSALERLVLAVERYINGRDRTRDHPAWGEDVKVMGVRQGKSVLLTVACAMIDRHLANADEYMREKSALSDRVQELAQGHGFDKCEVGINTADAVRSATFFVTVTGTSAEAGDDGEVGRGNRVNGLITPFRPMSLEAAAGKNPVSHIGKIYNILAQRIAEDTVNLVPGVNAAHCLMVSRIGDPVNRPSVLHIKLSTRKGLRVADIHQHVAGVAEAHLDQLTSLVAEFVDGAITVF